MFVVGELKNLGNQKEEKEVTIIPPPTKKHKNEHIPILAYDF